MLMKLLKFAPSLVVFSVSGVLLWPYFDRASSANPTAKGEEAPGPSSSPPKRAVNPQRFRDPFHLASLVAPAPTSAGAGKKAEPKVDPRQEEIDRLTELVGEMSLSGTYVHNRTRMAIIGGKIYSEREPILDEDGEPTGLVVRSVAADRVTLVGLGKEFPLGYPDRLESVEPGDAPAAGGIDDVSKALQAALGGENGPDLNALLPMLMNGQGGGLSGLLPGLLANRLLGAEPPPIGRPAAAARARAARAAAAPSGGDPALYGAADGPKGPKGKKAKAPAGPAGGDPALYADANQTKGPSKSSGSKAKKAAPAGGDPALYGGDSKKSGGRSKR